MSDNPSAPILSVVILNYNGARWMERCLASLRAQTIFDQLEVVVADNLSTDGSDRLAADLITGWANGRFVQNGANLGYCEGNNRAAAVARGDFLFFLNNDTWMAPDCLENLLAEVKRAGARAGTPMMFDYEDDTIQSPGGAGFDIFGLLSLATPRKETYEVFVSGGCSYLIERELFAEVGKFDPVFYLYADEYDLSWRMWIAGARAVAVPSARLHHRGAANVNPQGGGKIVEFRTSEMKRFYTNRNNLLVLLKNCQHILLLLVPLQIVLLGLEACVWLALTRRWAFVKRAYVEAILDCWRLRGHVRAERARVRGFRRHTDWWMLRFLHWRLNRWDELDRLRRWGVPKVGLY